MNLLIVYASNSGSTYLCTQIISEILSHNHSVAIKKPFEIKPEEFNKYDLILLGSPSWDFNGLEGMPHETFIEMMQKFSEKKYLGKKFAVFGCGDTTYTHFCGAVDHLETFVDSIKGERILNSLRIDSYFFDLDNNIKRVRTWAEMLRETLEGKNYTVIRI